MEPSPSTLPRQAKRILILERGPLPHEKLNWDNSAAFLPLSFNRNDYGYMKIWAPTISTSATQVANTTSRWAPSSPPAASTRR